MPSSQGADSSLQNEPRGNGSTGVGDLDEDGLGVVVTGESGVADEDGVAVTEPDGDGDDVDGVGPGLGMAAMTVKHVASVARLQGVSFPGSTLVSGSGRKMLLNAGQAFLAQREVPMQSQTVPGPHWYESQRCVVPEVVE